MVAKKRTHKESKGERRSSKKVPLTYIQKILMGKGAYASLNKSGLYSESKRER